MSDAFPFVYLMRRSDGAWKIGFSCDPEVRRHALRQEFRVSFKIIKVWQREDAYRIERVSQRLLRLYRDNAVDGRETFRAKRAVIMAAIEEAIRRADMKIEERQVEEAIQADAEESGA